MGKRPGMRRKKKQDLHREALSIENARFLTANSCGGATGHSTLPGQMVLALATVSKQWPLDTHGSCGTSVHPANGDGTDGQPRYSDLWEWDEKKRVHVRDQVHLASLALFAPFHPLWSDLAGC